MHQNANAIFNWIWWSKPERLSFFGEGFPYSTICPFEAFNDTTGVVDDAPVDETSTNNDAGMYDFNTGT